jgi:hypothetical protein
MARRSQAALVALIASAALAGVAPGLLAADDDEPPAGVDDSATLGEDSSATTIDVLANDTDSDGGPKAVASVTEGPNGAVAITSSGASLAYTPYEDFCGPDSFEYALNGGSTAVVSVTVTCVDDAPVAVNDSARLREDADATAIDVLANDTDVDEGESFVDSAGNPRRGSTLVTESGVMYFPDPDYCGADSFTYALNGGSSATVAVAVACVAPQTTINRAPRPRLKIRGRRARVRFRFASSDARSTFRCRLDRRAFRRCRSPRSYRLKPGRHTFRVVARDARGLVDRTPARWRVRVVRRPRR